MEYIEGDDERLKELDTKLLYFPPRENEACALSNRMWIGF